MLHTALYTAFSPVSAVLLAHPALEATALNPMAPATGLWVLDLALEAALWAQVGLLTQVAALPVYTGAGQL